MQTFTINELFAIVLFISIASGSIGYALGKDKANQAWITCLSHSFGRIGQLQLLKDVIEAGRKAAQGDYKP